MTDRPTSTPCPQHPDHPAGRCPICERAAVPPTDEFAAARAALRNRPRKATR